ncbi:MAG TPA: methyltransferase domain-containing protein, partial [Chitinophagaceae bacterium]|nr:methyltransferase domain-containing protein [Chitinophagaceae bacterium]
CNDDSQESDHCGLLQLRHSYDSEEMYGDEYGYRSGLNQSMVVHLDNKVKEILNIISLKPQDLIIDIGSNDGTLLKSYPSSFLNRVGIDPTGKKFAKYYPKTIKLIPDFFSAKLIQEHYGKKKALVVTSISMFYDLESPMDFMQQVYDILDDDGVWVFEQSYMPTMLKMNAYDTICHEHLEYYGMKQVKWMTDRIGFKIFDIKFNTINGGSFSIAVTKRNNKNIRENLDQTKSVLAQEKALKLSSLEPYETFKNNVFRHRQELLEFVNDVNAGSKLLLGYGASTKGNVVLQFCGLTEKDISCIADVNEDKFSCFTPGTGIPIVSESKAKALNPDYFLVLPWHFKNNILAREKTFLQEGGAMVFPLPKIEIHKK